MGATHRWEDCALEEDDYSAIRQLQESLDHNPSDPSVHFNLVKRFSLAFLLLSGCAAMGKGGKNARNEGKSSGAFDGGSKAQPSECRCIQISWSLLCTHCPEPQRALKCYQRAVVINPDDLEAGEALCDLLDEGGKESLVVAICREASEKSARAFWAFRRLGYLQAHKKKWSEAIQSLQHAIRGFPMSPDLWETLGLAYQRMGMFTAALKSYGRAVELDNSRVFALIESGNTCLMLGSFRKGIEHFQQTLEISPHNVSALYGLASALLGLAKECANLGAFRWGASLLELYRREGKKQLAQQAFDRARSIDPSLALPWAGMAADADARKLDQNEAYECCLRATQIFPLAEFQVGLAKLAMHSSYLSSSELKHGSNDSLGIQKGVDHLRKALHMYPNSSELRNLLSYLLFSSKEWRDLYLATRCSLLDLSDKQKYKGIKSAFEILGAGTVACYAIGSPKEKFPFPTCRHQHRSGSGAIQLLQKFLHQEPWNFNARYLLTLNCLQKARQERFAPQVCRVLERLTAVALHNQFYSSTYVSCQYQSFQLLLCAAEVNLQQGNNSECFRYARSASGSSVDNSSLFFAHLLLCRAYATEDDIISISKEYRQCLELGTDFHIGWISLKFIESRYRLGDDSTMLPLCFEDCCKDIKLSWNMWMGLFNMVQGLIAIWFGDFVAAEESFTQASSLADGESCVLLCHGAICMELARQKCESQYISRAIRSLMKAKSAAPDPLPIISLLLAQAEASLGSKAKWEVNLQNEWFSWPPAWIVKTPFVFPSCSEMSYSTQCEEGMQSLWLSHLFGAYGSVSSHLLGAYGSVLEVLMQHGESSLSD
ncbi:UNVERIFIED_CONTAM: Tetratricopeptide repeat protein SKI3 [Sesamum radiatum]|uniref:Tetratricopeptide repeat protein SKI3 n=1 Tax=Sesamum radiatum TaxID=300843 RepID=A0AAW2S590_SESRA